MHVGEKVAGEAGFLHAVMFDSLTLNAVVQWEGLAIDKQYHIAFSNVPYGSYYLVVSSDIDNDSALCIDDEGEFCQVYPLINSFSEIIVYDRDIDLGLFTLRFPEDLGGSSVSSSVGGTESQIEKSKGLEYQGRD